MYLIRTIIRGHALSVDPYTDKKEAIHVFNNRVIEALDFPEKISIALVENPGEQDPKIIAQFIIRETLTGFQ